MQVPLAQHEEDEPKIEQEPSKSEPEVLKIEQEPSKPEPEVPKIEQEPVKKVKKEPPKPKAKKEPPKPKVKKEPPKPKVKKEPSKPEVPKIEQEPPKPEPEVPKIEQEPSKPEKEVPKIEQEPSKPEQEVPKIEQEPSKPEVPRIEQEPSKPEVPKIEPTEIPCEPDPVKPSIPVVAEPVPKAKSSIYITNVDLTLTSADLHKKFACYGLIVECKVVNNYDGSSQGWAYIDFEGADAAQRVVNASKEGQGIVLADKRVEVGTRMSSRTNWEGTILEKLERKGFFKKTSMPVSLFGRTTFQPSPAQRSMSQSKPVSIYGRSRLQHFQSQNIVHSAGSQKVRPVPMVKSNAAATGDKVITQVHGAGAASGSGASSAVQELSKKAGSVGAAVAKGKGRCAIS